MKDKKRLILMIFLAVSAVVVAAIAVKFFFFNGVFLYAGTLEATKVDLAARVPSSIGNVKVQEGDHVAENQELVVLSCEDVRLAAELAGKDYQRTASLFRTKNVSQETMDHARTLKEDADVKMNWCSVRSPIPGIVLNRYHEPGEWVIPGTKLLTLANIRDIWAYIYVPQPEVSRLKAGMKVKGYLPELGNREFDGKIVKINDEAEFTPKNVQTRAERTRLIFGVKISFADSNAEEILKPGMTIEVELPRE